MGFSSTMRRYARLKLAKQQGNKCYYCGRGFTEGGSTSLTLEHLRPKCEGGEDIISNFAAACAECNHARGRQSNQRRQNQINHDGI